MKRTALLATLVTLFGVGAASLASAAPCGGPKASADGCACGNTADKPTASAPSVADPTVYAPN